MRLAALFAALLLPLLPTAAAAQGAPTATLALASQTPWVDGDGSFTVRLDVDAVRNPSRLELAVTVHRAVRTRSQFVRTMEGELLGAVVERQAYEFASRRFDPGGAIPLTLDAADLRVGVYPVVFELVDTETDDVVASLVTHLLKVPPEPVEVPLNVAWIQSYGVDPALQPTGEVELTDEDLDQLRTIAARLDDGAPLTITPTPETIAALATVDDGRTVRALAELLADHQVVSSPFVDLDVSAVVGAGRGTDLARQRLEGDAVLDDLLGVSGDIRSWSFVGPVTRSALRAVHDLGVRRVVLDEDALEPIDDELTGGLTLTRPFEVEGSGGTELDAVAVDRGLVAHFTADDEVLAAHQLLADLAVLQLDAPGTVRGIVIRPPEDWEPTETFLSIALGGIGSSPLLRPVTLDGLFDAVGALVNEDDEPVVRRLADASAPDLTYDPTVLDRARTEMAGLSSLLLEPDGNDLDALDRSLLVAESADLTPGERSGYVDSVLRRVGSASQNVRVLGDRTYRLTAREGTIPLTLVNDNDFPVQVDLDLTSDKLEFTDGSVGRLVIRGLVLDADRTTTEAVPVKARTSGTFTLRVRLSSPDGRLDIGTSQVVITSTVASGVGLLLSIGAGLFLALWWGSHWRTVRRARRLVDAE